MLTTVNVQRSYFNIVNVSAQYYLHSCLLYSGNKTQLQTVYITLQPCSTLDSKLTQ